MPASHFFKWFILLLFSQWPPRAVSLDQMICGVNNGFPFFPTIYFVTTCNLFNELWKPLHSQTLVVCLILFIQNPDSTTHGKPAPGAHGVNICHILNTTLYWYDFLIFFGQNPTIDSVFLSNIVLQCALAQWLFSSAPDVIICHILKLHRFQIFCEQWLLP